MAASRTPDQRYDDGIATITDHRQQATDIRNARAAQGESVAGIAAVNAQTTKEAELADLFDDSNDENEGQEVEQQIHDELNAIFKQPKIQAVSNTEVNQGIVDYIGGLLVEDEELALLLRDKFTTVGTTVERRREKVGSMIEQEIKEAKQRIAEKIREVAELKRRNKDVRKKVREVREAAQADQEARVAAEAKVTQYEHDMSTNAPVLGPVVEDDEDEQAARDHVIEVGIFGEEFPKTWSKLENIVDHIIGSTVTIKNEAVQEAVADMREQVEQATAAAEQSMESLEAANATIIELRTKHRVEKRRADEAESKLERSIADHRVTTVQYQAATEALQNARTDNEKSKGCTMLSGMSERQQQLQQ
jgi:hypothetical protein